MLISGRLLIANTGDSMGTRRIPKVGKRPSRGGTRREACSAVICISSLEVKSNQFPDTWPRNEEVPRQEVKFSRDHLTTLVVAYVLAPHV